MEKSTYRKHSLNSVESKVNRSNKARRSKSSKSSRESKGSASISTIKKVEQVDEEDATNYKESITDLFFDSFLDAIIAERTAKHGDLDHSSSSLSGVIKSLTESHDSVLESAHTFETTTASSGTTLSKLGSKSIRSSFTGPKEPSTHKSWAFSQSTQSEQDNTFTKENDSFTSCASSCPCNWRIVFKNGNIYEGQTNGTLMHGKGVFYWSDGSIYRGDFKDGHPWGQGKLVLPDLSTYEGEFCMGFFHGHGTFNVKSTPLLYKGEWRYDQRNGRGWLLYETNNWYEGDWANNKKHGKGYRQYSNGSTYKGEWLNDKINGEGCMFWSNNDCYIGEWSNGYQYGYGEYTWNLIAHDKFIFPNYNWYKGNWIDGYRSGAGIMNFGHESGAKLAGTWQMNRKDGPGLMICGNGMILQRNPLFKDDKPSPFEACDLDISSTSKSSVNDWINLSNGTEVFKTISDQIKTKENLNYLNRESIINITRSGTNIKMRQYIKLLEKKTGNAPPLKIPIHNKIHEVDLSYFVHNVQRGNINLKETDMSTLEINQLINSKTINELPSNINYIPSNNEIYTHLTERSASQHSIPDVNELKNLIINHLPQLRDIYRTYASFCAKEEELTFEPVLVRLFLWQIYRDMGVTNKHGISIVEIDEMLAKNPKSCLETVHNPWEPIYFWQFLQALVGVASLLYAHTHKMDYTPTSGFMYHMFKSFLENRLFPTAGKFEGNCLTHLKDLVPISSMYRLYKEVGEPHTTEEFLKNTCLKKGRDLPCYKIINCENNDEYSVQTGTNIVGLNNEVIFSEKSRIILKYDQDNRYEKQSLYTFTKLGRKQILKCLAKICPQIITDTGRIVLHYRLSFIEFYEAILLLAYEKVEQERLKLLEETKGPSVFGLGDAKGFSREMSKISQHSGKKKKLKK